jgi:ectoine hydroxylase-related dioxygenase (phytanoyl-CoA dioxygenase family)
MPPPEAPKIVLEMDKGDIVFFHPYLLHGSGENKVLTSKNTNRVKDTVNLFVVTLLMHPASILI